MANTENQNETTDKKNEIDILIPENEVRFGEHAILVQPFPFYEFPKVTKLIAVLGVGIVGALKNFATEGDEITINAEGLQAISDLMQTNFKDLVELMACFTDKTADWLLEPKNGLDHESALLLLAKIVERNKRFFMKTLKSVLPTE